MKDIDSIQFTRRMDPFGEKVLFSLIQLALFEATSDFFLSLSRLDIFSMMRYTLTYTSSFGQVLVPFGLGFCSIKYSSLYSTSVKEALKMVMLLQFVRIIYL
jgi:hypothetical protein